MIVINITGWASQAVEPAASERERLLLYKISELQSRLFNKYGFKYL